MKAQMNAIGIVTGNMPEALRFYRLLGLEIEEPKPDEPHVECALPNGVRIMWDTEALIKQIDPNWVQPVGQRIGLAFELPSPEGVDALYVQVLEAGFKGKAEPWDAFWGQRYAQVFDPDGNAVDLFAAQP